MKNNDEEPQGQSKPVPQVPMMRQLDRVAKEINPLLVIFMLGLGLLDLTCYLGLAVSQAQHARAGTPTAISASYPR